MKKTNLVLVIMLIMVLAMGTNLMAQTTATAPAGSGTSEVPYLISNLAELSYLCQNLGAIDYWASGVYIKQTADIDATETQYWDDAGSGDLYDDLDDGTAAGNNEGFSPIGNISTHFTGSYDGDGHTIDNLFINRSSTNYNGLFGYTSGNGTIVKNIGVINVDITGKEHVGGLVGYNSTNATVNNSYSTGSVSASGFVGGLVGYIYNATVNNSYSTGSVSASGDFVGGLVGHNYNNAEISNSYSTGSVNGSGSSDYVGGLVGLNYTSSTISNSYSTGTVSGNTNVGGLVGYNNTTVTNSFWDITIESTDNGIGTGKTTAEMKTQSTFTDASWDFTTIWEMIGYNYPRLIDNPDSALPATLSSFTASFTGGSSTLSWTTQSESSNLGWNVYRSETEEFADGSMQNADLIEGAGTTSEPTDYAFTDPYPVVDGSDYWFWIESISFSGESEIFGPVSLSVPNSDPGQNTPVVPETFGLYQNYPNPFNPTTEISFALEKAGDCELMIYDVKGRKIKTLFTGNIEADRVYSFIWNGEDESGKDVSSGIYYYKMKAGKYSATKKMILLK